MKKLFTLLSITVLSSAGFAQQLNSTGFYENKKYENKKESLKVSGFIYQQEIVNSQGIVASALADGSFVASADDFKLTETSKVTKISISGFQNKNDLDTNVAQGVMLYIYEDDNGKPAGIPGNSVVPVAKLDISKSSSSYRLINGGDGFFIYIIDISKELDNLVLLKDKTYWLVFAVKTNLTSHSVTERFNWYSGTVVGNKSKLVDPSNAFRIGATNWTDIGAILGTNVIDGLAFSIQGETSLGTGEIYSNVKKINVYPNPVTSELNISLKDAKISQVELTDMIGRTVNVKVTKEGKVDTSSLSKGVYILTVKDDKGVSHIQKIVKK